MLGVINIQSRYSVGYGIFLDDHVIAETDHYTVRIVIDIHILDNLVAAIGEYKRAIFGSPYSLLCKVLDQPDGPSIKCVCQPN